MREDTQKGWVRAAVAAGGVLAITLGAAPLAAQDSPPGPFGAVVAQGEPAPKTRGGPVEGKDPNAKPAKKVPEIKYNPILRGAPRKRVGGGARSGGATASPPVALAPEHVGFTTSSTPTLFWFVETLPPAGTAVVFTLTDESRFEPLVESELPKLARAGVQHVDLSTLGVEVEPDTEYAWSITIVRDPEARSHDLIGTGHLSRVAKSPTADTATALAASGLWYDALAAARRDEDESQTWDSLLRQAGLESAIVAP